MKRKLLSLFLIMIIASIAMALVFTVSGFGSFDRSGPEITPWIVKQLPECMGISGARVLRARCRDGMRGGELIVQLELPAHQLAAFLAASPFNDTALDSQFVPGELCNSTWALSPQRCDDLEKSHLFSGGSISMNHADYSILIDRSRPDVYVIFYRWVW